MTHEDCPETCDACGAPQRNYREHAYPHWQFYECGRRYSPDLKQWAGVVGRIHEPECLRRQLAAAIEENERLRQVSSIIWRDWLSTTGCAALEKSWPAMRALGDLVEDGRLSEKSAAWLAALAQEKPK